MLRRFFLQLDEEKRLQVEGKYLTITQASGPIELTIGGTLPVTVDEKDRIHLRDDSPNDRSIRIKNVSSGHNFVEIHTSDLLIDKRTAIDVNNSISIAADQLVGIDPMANIVQAEVTNPVRFDATDNIVKIDPLANAVEATIQNSIQIDPTANAVDATIQNAVQIDSAANEVTPVHAVQTFSSLPTITFAASSPPIEIAGNALRDTLILSSDASNIGTIWIGGVANEGTPLAPGQRIEWRLISALNVVGDENDTLYIGQTLHT